MQLQVRTGQLAVAVDASLLGPPAHIRDPLGGLGAGGARLGVQQIGRIGTVHSDHEIEPVHERAGQAALVAGQRSVGAAAADRAARAARAGVHGGHQQEPGRVLDHPLRAGHPDHALLKRLAQGVQHRRRELSELIEEEHAAGGRAHLPGPGPGGAPSHQGGHRRRMVGGPERRTGDQPIGQRQSRSRMDPGDLQGRLRRQIGQQADKAARQHGLARPRRPDKQQVVRSGRGHLQRPPSQRLARDVGEVRLGLGWSHPQSRGRVRPGRGARQRVEHLPERPDGADPIAGHQRSHGAVAGRHDHRGVVNGVDQGQRSGHRPDRAVESELPQNAGVGDRSCLKLLVGDEHPDRDREVEPGARLRHVARREVDGDALHRPMQLAGDDGGPDAVAGLPARRVGQADDRESRQPVGYVDLH